MFIWKIVILCIYLGSGWTEMILTSPQVTNFGRWHDWERCPLNTFVVGMQLKTHSYQGAFSDDTALNGIKFFCDDIGSRKDEIYAVSGYENWGSFGNKYFCEGVATGFQLRSEKYQSVFADDTAANNLRLYCNSNTTQIIEGDGLGYGDWTSAQECFKKQAICAISTQVEIKHSTTDETAFNNLKVACCDVPDPAAVCDPDDTWDLIIECDNTQALSPTTCTYARKVGISHSSTSSEHHSHLSEVYFNIGFSIPAALSVLSSNFRLNLGSNSTTGHDWTTSTSEIWSVETTTTVSFDVPVGVKTQLFQTLGHCGIYSVRATRVKRIDTEGETKEQSISYIEI